MPWGFKASGCTVEVTAISMELKQISEDEFFDGLNERIAEMSEEIGGTAETISNNPDSSTYHFDNFFYPLKVMKQLQRMRDKARAFKEHENEELVYVKKLSEGEKPKYYYLPQSKFDQSRLPELIEYLEKRQTPDRDTDLGYIS